MNDRPTSPPTRPDQPPIHGYDPPPAAAMRHPSRRSNGLVLFVIGAAVVFLSCSIIALAALAGYNDGLRHVERQAEITRQADIAHQYSLALTDVAGGNRELAALRLEHVVITLGARTGEAAALLTQVRAVTPTPTLTATFTPSPTLEHSPTPTAPPAGGLPSLDPAALLAEAQAASVLRDWERAINLLDILIGVDPTYQRAEVQRLLREALVALSRTYLLEPSGEHLAEGILLAERAQTLGDIGDLAYEAYVAGRYLDALNAEGMECLLSVREWERVYNEAPRYRDVAPRLANAYARCGDAYTYQTEYCPAEQYYTWSLQTVYDSSVASRRDQAREVCAQATPTPTPTPDPLAVPPTGEPSPQDAPSG